MRRTIPADSFAPSSINLMLNRSRPLLSAEMNSHQRLAAAWNDMPFGFSGKARHELVAWDDKCRYELGIKRIHYQTKGNWIMTSCGWFFALMCIINFISFPYRLAFFGLPEHLSREKGPAYAKATYGVDVWCADGKFIRPHFHISPPMFTMTADEL